MFASCLRSFLQVLACCAVGLSTTAFAQARADAYGGHDLSEPATKPEAQGAARGGLAAEDWAGIRSAHEESRHAAYAVEGGGYQAHNPGQQWLASFDGRGFSVLPDAGGWTWGLQLERYGFVGSEQEVTSPARMSAEGGRVIYEWNETLEEWYVNDARGLEHGFTVASRPVADEQGSANPLSFTFAVRGPLRPKLDADGRGVRFLGEKGAIVLTYTGLLVVDADGRELEASFECLGEQLLLSVAEGGARYPLTIDPIVQQETYLKSHDVAPGSALLGQSVSVSGDTVVVGAPGTNRVHVFVRSGASWVQQTFLTGSNTDLFDRFGDAVSLWGDTLVVGAENEDSSATGVNGNQSDNSAMASGAAYVFVRTGTTWSQQAYLKASNTEANDRFGSGVSLSGDTVLVAASREDSSATGVNGNQSDNGAADSGAAYVFVRSGTSWSQQAYLKASNTDAGDFFGGHGAYEWTGSAALSGDTIVVGAPQEGSSATGVNGDQSDNGAMYSGAAYVFVRSGTSWSQQAYLKASNTGAGDAFGWSVAVSHERMSTSGARPTVVVGALLEDSDANGINGHQNNNSAEDAGAAYVFVRSGTSWNQQAYIKSSDSALGHRFGYSVSISGQKLVVGESDRGPGTIAFGAASLFLRSGAAWSQQGEFMASSPDNGDLFGNSVSLSGGTVVVGAPFEDSRATGVNGDQADNSATSAGAAYVFETSCPVTYCTGKTTSAGCIPFISSIGVPNTSSGLFDILSNNHIEGRRAIYLYSLGKANLDFHGGKLCVKAPFRHLRTLIKATDGLACTGCAGNCRMFSRNFNQLIQSGSDPALTAGQQVFVQVRQRDTNDPTGFGDNLSDALGFTIAP